MSTPTPAPMCPQHPDEAMSAVAHPLLRWICVRCAVELAGGVSTPGDSAPPARGRARPAPAAGWAQRLGARGPGSAATLLETLAGERDRLRSVLELVELLTGQGGASSRRRPPGSSGQPEPTVARGPGLLSHGDREQAPDRADSAPAEEEGESGPASLTDVLLEQSPALRAVLDAAQPRWNKLVQALGAEGAGVLDDAESVWRQASSADERRAPGSAEDSPVSPVVESDDTDEDHPER